MQWQVSKDDLKKLFVHGVPPSVQPADLLQLFEACTCACPSVEGNMQDRRGESGLLCLLHLSAGLMHIGAYWLHDYLLSALLYACAHAPSMKDLSRQPGRQRSFSLS